MKDARVNQTNNLRIGLIATTAVFVLAGLIISALAALTLFVFMPEDTYHAAEKDGWKALNVRTARYDNPEGFLRAEAILSKMLVSEAEQDFMTPHYLLGQLYAEKGDDVKAIEHYQQLLGEASKSWYLETIYHYFLEDAHSQLALIYYKQGNNDAALKHLNAIEEITYLENPYLLYSLQDSLKNPDSASAHFKLAVQLRDALYVQEAQQEFKKALQLSKDRQLRLEVKNYLAIKMPRHPERITPMARYYSLTGEKYEKLGKTHLAKAEAFYKRALAETPDFEWVYHHLSIVYRNMGEHDKAVEYANRALALNPGFYLPYFTLGDIETTRGDAQLKLIETKGSKTNRVKNQDYLRKAQTSYGAAINYYSKGLSMGIPLTSPQDTELKANIQNQLGYLYEQLQKPQNAMQHYKTAMDLAVDYPEDTHDDYDYAENALDRLRRI